MADDFGFGFDVQFPEIDWNFGLSPYMPNFQLPPLDFSFGIPSFNWDFGGYNFSDPLSLPAYNDFFLSPLTGNLPDFSAYGIPDPGFQGLGGGGAAPPMMLSDLLDTQAYGGSAGAPSLTLGTESLPRSSDPLTNLMGTQQGLGVDPAMQDVGGIEAMFGLGPQSALTGGSAYATPGGGTPGPWAAGLGQPGTGPNGEPSMEALQRQVLQGNLNLQNAQLARMNEKPSTWDTITKLAAAFGPVALGAAGIGLQQANRPSRNPLEDDLLRAKIQSTGLQDTLAKDRLAFERENAEATRSAQAEMQAALLESRRPGGQANIDALLKGNPQLAALYQALTSQTTGLANGGDAQFNALIDQVAQVDIAELRRQADQQKAQALELAARQGVNPANIIAEIEQRFLQESAKARANARNTLIQQLTPGINVLNSLGSLFGTLYQTPSA